MAKLTLILLMVGIIPITLTEAKIRDREEGDRIRTGHYVDEERKGKLFSLFAIVNFQNSGCQSTVSLTQGQSTFRNGTCYTNTECANRGGTSSGTCAAGFGVCCVFIVSSGTTITENCTYIQNPSFPTSDTATTAGRSYTVQRCSGDVCSLRLDFETFTLQGPISNDANIEGNCVDTFVVTTPGTNQNIPTICGENSGQHIYVDIGAGNGNTATLDFTLVGTTFGRLWDVKVTQVECANPNRPPQTCLQYLTGLTGRIESFNFQSTDENHLANQNYGVCIRPELGICCIQYMVCPDESATTSAALTPGFSLDPNLATAMTDEACSTVDYVGIDQSSDTCQSGTSTSTGTVANRYCGRFFNFLASAMVNNVVCDCTQPFSVDIFTDGIPDQGIGIANVILSRGLCLEYMQVACS